MIQLCNCIKGSASTVDLSRKQATASCKNCGGKQLIDVRRSLSGSMLSTMELELTSAINPALSWKTISKGNRSASRRARKFVARSLNGSQEPVEEPKRIQDMTVSESEKIGVTILGGRFSDKIEHVPIKKRRFLFRSPSPPPRTPPCLEKSERLMMSQPDQESFSNVIANEQGMAVDTAVLNERNSEEISEKLSDDEDFSGISILAAAACNNNIGGGAGNAEEGSFIEESSAQKGSFEVLVNSGSSSIAKTSCKENSPSCAEISNDGTESCISAMPVEDTTASSKNLAFGNNIEGHFLSDNTVVVSQNPSSSKDDGGQRQIKSSLLDDRSHWDLNTSMDSWESPCDDTVVDSQPNAVISEDGLHNVNLVNLGCREVQTELGDTKYDMETTMQHMVGISVLNDVDKEMYRLTDSRSLALRIHGSTDEDHKMDPCTDFDRASCIQEKVPSDIDKARNSVMDLSEETKPLHNQESFSSSAESVLAPVEHALKLPVSVNTSVVANGCASAVSLSFRSTGNSGTVSSQRAVVCTDERIDHHACPGAGHISSTPVSEENGVGVSTVAIGMQKGYDCTAEVQSDESKSLSSPQAEKLEVALPCVEISKNASCNIDSILTEDAECVDGIAGLCDNGNVPEKMMSSYVMSCQPLVVPGPLDDDVMRNAVSASDKVDGSQCSPNCEELPASCASFGKGEPVVAADTMVQDKVLATETTAGNSPLKPADNSFGLLGRMVDVQGGFSSHETCKSYVNAPVNSSDKVALEEDFDDINYDSDVSQDDHGRIVGIEKVVDLQSGYDSQYEDGELRESVVYAWEENASEEGEAERVDYGSDNAQVEEVAESTKEKSANVEADQVLERNLPENYYAPFLGVSSKVEVMEAGSSTQRADAIKFSGRDLLEIHSKKNHTSALMDGLDLGDSMAKVVGSTTSRRELSSRIEGPTSSLLRKDRLCAQGNRSTNFDDSNHRVERDTNCCKSIGRVGSSLRMHGRGWGAEHRVDSSGAQWGSRRCYSTRYYDPAGFGHPVPKNAAAAVAAKLESTGFLVARDGTLLKAGVMAPNGRIRRPTVNVSSHGVYQCLTRRGSPTDKDGGFGMLMGLGPVGEMSPGRSINVGRGRPGRYSPQVVDTGLRDRCHRPVPDGIIDSSFHMQHPLTRRERSFSPIQRRGAPHLSRSQTKSPSRSRTRSPLVCSSPTGRNGGGIVGAPALRHRSRSPPNFKYEARMERVRSPHQRPGFSAQHIVGFISPRSRRRSPQYTSRWIDDRKDAVDHFREHGYKQRSSVSDRRSLGRTHPKRHRFDFVDSPGRLKPDEYRKPMHHPGRFPEMFGTCRGPRYEGSDDDRRKHNDRYGMVHPMRRYNRDGAVKRFHYGVEDAFAAHNSHNKKDIGFHGRGSPEDYDSSVDNRLGDEPRRAKGEKSRFRYGEDGKFNANSKSSGLGEFEEDVAPRRRRSS